MFGVPAPTVPNMADVNPVEALQAQMSGMQIVYNNQAGRLAELQVVNNNLIAQNAALEVINNNQAIIQLEVM
jgi:hypothetical protein